MNAKKIFRHPVLYVLLIAALLIAGFSLFTAFSGPKHVTVQEGLELLNDGKVAEAGTHNELMKLAGEYYKLYMLQLEALKVVAIG